MTASFTSLLRKTRAKRTRGNVVCTFYKSLKLAKATAKSPHSKGVFGI